MPFTSSCVFNHLSSVSSYWWKGASGLGQGTSSNVRTCEWHVQSGALPALAGGLFLQSLFPTQGSKVGATGTAATPPARGLRWELLAQLWISKLLLGQPNKQMGHILNLCERFSSEKSNTIYCIPNLKIKTTKANNELFLELNSMS